MKRLLITAAIAFQVLAVAAIAVNQEWILATGDEVVFQTAPIDPRDLFRGDYVRLNYLFSTVPPSVLDDPILNHGVNKGDQVYLSLERGHHGHSKGVRLSLAPPVSGPYLAGRVKQHWPYKSYRKSRGDHPEADRRRLLENPQPLTVKYGIEQYYVEQGAGKKMETLRGTRSGFQVPLLIHAALSDSGKAVIRSHEWANIALKTEVLRSPKRDAPDEQASAVIRFSIKNRSSRTITLPWKGNHCSFALEPINKLPDGNNEMGLGRTGCADAALGEKRLAPGEEIAIEFDLNDPRWYVNYKGKPTPMGKLPWHYRFRVVHESEDAQGVNARIISRAFHGRGTID